MAKEFYSGRDMETLLKLAFGGLNLVQFPAFTPIPWTHEIVGKSLFMH